MASGLACIVSSGQPWNEASVHEVKIVGNALSHTVRVELKC
jgi:hypothetical protein